MSDQEDAEQDRILIVDEPAETPDKPQAEKTKTELFQEALSQFSDKETAKSHIPEIADKLGCSKGIGYKVLKRIREFKKGEINAVTPTIKIVEGKGEPVEQEEEPTPEDQEGLEELPSEEAATETTPSTATPTTIEALSPVLERSLQRLFNYGVEMASGMSDALNTEESRDTAILMPFLIFRLTRQKLTEDNFIDMTAATHFGSIIVKVISKKLKERKEKPVNVPPPQKEETSKPKKETSKEKEAPTPLETQKKPESIIETPEPPKTAGFLKQL